MIKERQNKDTTVALIPRWLLIHKKHDLLSIKINSNRMEKLKREPIKNMVHAWPTTLSPPMGTKLYMK
jgi:hypothetical protein